MTSAPPTSAPPTSALPTTTLPTEEEIGRRLEEILARDSANVGVGADMDRLTVMLTRSCELRCSYCFVAVREEGAGRSCEGELRDGLPEGDLSAARLRSTIDLLMRSPRPRLGLQLFGGEPTRRWDVLEDGITYAISHPERRGRPLEMLLTTNGLGLEGEPATVERRLALLRSPEIIVELSVDGDVRGNRFRRAHLVTTDDAHARIGRAMARMREAGVRFFANVTVPPAAAGELYERYVWAREAKAPALQLNYATGMAWTAEQRDAYLSGLARALEDHHARPEGLALFNWHNGADPVPLCADVIVDTDGTILQMGGIFHEKRFPVLRAAYLRGHVDMQRSFEGLRIHLGELYALTRRTLDDEGWAIFDGNTRLGAATDLVVERTRARLGRRRG